MVGWRTPLTVAAVAVITHSSFCLATWLLIPTCLLVLPCSAGRRIQEWCADQVKSAVYSLTTLLLHLSAGTRIYVHVKGGHATLKKIKESSNPAVVVANHRTNTCWLWLWAFGTIVDRLQGWKIVMTDGLRQIPFIGWFASLNGSVFINRGIGQSSAERNSEATLERLRSSIETSIGKEWPTLLQIFPEGRDLNPKSLKASDEFADKHGLPHYKHVLHPKTTGFVHIVQTFAERSPEPPWMLDVTLAYVDRPKETPCFLNAFIKGNPAKELHMRIDVHDKLPKEASELDKLCKDSFKQKEKVLSDWYGAEADATKDRVAKLLGNEPGWEMIDTTSAPFIGLWVRNALVVLGNQAAMYFAYRSQGFWRYSLFVALEIVAMTWLGKNGGADTLLLNHAKRWPREVNRKKE